MPLVASTSLTWHFFLEKNCRSRFESLELWLWRFKIPILSSPKMARVQKAYILVARKTFYHLSLYHLVSLSSFILYTYLISSYHHNFIEHSVRILSARWSLSKTPFGNAQLALWVLSPERSWRRDLLHISERKPSMWQRKHLCIANHMSSKGGLIKFSPVKSSIPFSKGVRCKSWYKRPQHLDIETWRCNLTSSHPLFSAKPEASCKSRPWHLSRRTSCHGNVFSRTSRKTVKLLLCCRQMQDLCTS